MRPELKQVLEIFAGWILIAVLIWYLVPPDLKWMAWVPTGFILIAVIVSGFGIFFRRIGFFKPRIAHVLGKDYKSCEFCPAAQIKDNPVNKNVLIYKCGATGAGMRLIYNPRRVPRWCPYVTH